MNHRISWSLAAAVCVLVGMTVPGWALTSVWNTTDGGNWSTGWDIDYPKATGDTGTISAVGWTAGQSTVTVNVADITGGSVQLTGTTTSTVNFSVANDATFDSVLMNLTGGSAQNRLSIAAGKTLTANNFSYTNWIIQSGWGSGATLKFKPDGSGNATFGFVGQQQGFSGNNSTVDFSGVTTLFVNQTSLNAQLEERDTTWKVGSATGNQTWSITTPNANGHIWLQQRTQSGPWQFVKVGSNNVDMSKVDINRNALLNFGIAVTNQGRLFTDASGLQVGGTVTIGDYYLPNLFSNTANYVEMDTVGANLTIASGGKVKLSDDETTANAVTYDNDVTALRLLAGNTLTVNGTGGILIQDANAATAGRLGIWFAGSTVDSRGDLKLTGPNTFLNGGAGGTVKVGGNLTVQSRNAAGFASLSSSPTDATFDDFDVRATAITMDGGGSKTITWTTDAAHGVAGSLAAAAFTTSALANLVVDSLTITGSTTVNWALGSELYLDNNLTINPGSALNFTAPSGSIHLYDPDLSELTRLQGYLAAGQLSGWTIVTTTGVGISLIPEPASLALIGAGLLLVVRRRRAARG